MKKVEPEKGIGQESGDEREEGEEEGGGGWRGTAVIHQRGEEGGGGGASTVSSAPPGGATKKIPSPPRFFRPTGQMFKQLQTFRIILVSVAFERLLMLNLKLLSA